MKLKDTFPLILLAGSPNVSAAAIDDIRIEASHDLCDGAGARTGANNNFIVYATNLSSGQIIDGNFKYETSPPQQHFILFDANLNPITDRFPKFHSRRLQPRESARIGCTFTFRAAPEPPVPLMVPLIISKQSASYADSNGGESVPEDARSFAAFALQGGINECGSGTKPPGLFYLINLHPYARLSVSMNLLDDHGTRVGVLTPDLPPLSAVRVGCSNGYSKPGPIGSAGLEASAGVAVNPPAAPPPEAPAAPVPLSLGAILRVQNVCAGSVPPGWVKINDAWNPTVCGNPTTLTYNVWTIQQLSDQPLGASIYACKGVVPLGWAMVDTTWNPTVCGHPATRQSNVMAIKRLN